MFHNFRLDQKAIPANLIRNTINWLESLGYSSSGILDNTAIHPEALKDDDQRFTYRQRINLIENILDTGSSAGFWLDRPQQTEIKDYGLLGYAMMSCENLEQAVHIAVKYHRMAGAMYSLQFVTEGDDAVLRLDHLMAGGLVGQYLVEELFIGMPLLISQLLGEESQPKEIRLNYPAPPYADRYEEVFACPVYFGMPFCEYRFSGELLDKELSKADPNIARVCEDSCRNLLNQMEIEQGLVSQICHILLSQPGNFPSLDLIAGRLHIGTRTLRRRLQQLGTSYQQILDDVRHELATEYLLNTDLAVHEVSDLLGFSESTNFRRAFLKWSGESPYQCRKRHLQGIPAKRLTTRIN